MIEIMAAGTVGIAGTATDPLEGREGKDVDLGHGLHSWEWGRGDRFIWDL